MTPPLPSPPSPSRDAARRRALAGFAVLAVLLHVEVFRMAGQATLGADRERPPGSPMAVRTIEPPVSAKTTGPSAEAAPPAAPPRRARLARAPREPGPPRGVVAPAPEQPRGSTTPSGDTAPSPADAVEAPAALEAASDAASGPVAAAPESDAAAPSGSPGPALAGSPPVEATEPPSPPPGAASAVAPAASATFLAAGEMPPPTYRTLLPPPTVLHYEVRRGFFRGAGEIRWAPAGDRYALRLEARLAGVTLLAQTSDGEIGETGLAPTRFLDQRARRPLQAANFRRGDGRITFSGPSTEWPLLPGSQDRLSWMIQLVGIVAADPGLASDGSRISMVLVGARGEASVRTLRFAGREAAETASGSVPAVKFVVDPRGAYDGSYEIWLDPARGYLPVHATSRNAAGESEFDLLLQRIEP